MTLAHVIPTTNPCPGWCELESGHGYDNELAEPDRTHRRSISEMVTVEQLEFLVMSADGIETRYTPPRAFVLTSSGEELDADQAEQIGRELIEAARMLRAISA